MVDVKVGNAIFCVNTFYRPPTDDATQQGIFLETTEKILTKINTRQHDNAIIAADLNFGNCYSKFPALTPKSLDSLAPDLFASFGMTQIIDICNALTSHVFPLQLKVKAGLPVAHPRLGHLSCSLSGIVPWYKRLVSPVSETALIFTSDQYCF